MCRFGFLPAGGEGTWTTVISRLINQVVGVAGCVGVHNQPPRHTKYIIKVLYQKLVLEVS